MTVKVEKGPRQQRAQESWNKFHGGSMKYERQYEGGKQEFFEQKPVIYLSLVMHVLFTGV